MNAFDLSGKTALVTGASRGLGKGFALALAKAGADVVVTSRTAASLEATVEEIHNLGRRAWPVVLDVREKESIEAAAETAWVSAGKLDILVNNAGCNVRKPALEVTWEDWNLILDTNLRGVFFTAQAIARRMVERGYGRIINIGSVTCVNGYAGLAPYGASRGGVKQLTMSLADDWGKHGITVNCLAPGWFRTEMTDGLMFGDERSERWMRQRTPMGRGGEEHELDGALLFLASDASSFMTGQTLCVDGGWTAV